MGPLEPEVNAIPAEPPILRPIRPIKIEDSISSLLDINDAEKVKPEDKSKQGSSVIDINNIGTQTTFGSRLLTDPAHIDNFNAWDHVEWDEAHLANATERIAFHSANPVPKEDQAKYGDAQASHHWDEFYARHEEGFFKDRKWINLEFPELIACTEADAGCKVIADIGCAVGNTVYPLLRVNRNSKLTIHALDFSPTALGVLKSNPEYDPTIVKAGVWDMAEPTGPPSTIPHESVDIVVIIFAFSALSPNQWSTALRNLRMLLKPGGLLLMRDYGRYDLTQIRFKANRLLQDSFYIRGDGTRVYYFTNEELSNLFHAESGWKLEQNAIDKRLLVNRKEGKRMYRAWVQVKARRT